MLVFVLAHLDFGCSFRWLMAMPYLSVLICFIIISVVTFDDHQPSSIDTLFICRNSHDCIAHMLMRDKLKWRGMCSRKILTCR